ncbi:MAG: DegT/DnrJ/EryC1/StrS family aminotransferase [Oscillospiraceae bacterium]|nr:DegT/DnrJ/EryC1/StrS family aminotransferase [Oscillospiraceae bacterium]
MTPLFGAARGYIEKDAARFHMPGHKGFLPPPLHEAAPYDLTEIDGLDSLYEAGGALAEMEAEYSALYGTAASFLSAGGSTLCIQAMLALALMPGDKLVCARGVHTAAVNAMALLDVDPVWVYPRGDAVTGLMGAVAPGDVEKALESCPDARAVYITSPTYLGVMADISGIAAVCSRYGVPLLVDNAHGAHLRFLQTPLHPIGLGAAMCADSLHKTLPVLTGGALLHIADKRYRADARRKMALFGSTSPSYLIMLSCDRALDYINNEARGDMARLASEIKGLKKTAAERGFGFPDGLIDPLRLTLDFTALGYTGSLFGAYARQKGIEPEYLGARHGVFLAGPGNTAGDFARLRDMIADIPRLKPYDLEAVLLEPPRRACSLRQAIFAPGKVLPLHQCRGRIAAAVVAPCPPGMPVTVPGEIITDAHMLIYKNYGIFEINVVE